MSEFLSKMFDKKACFSTQDSIELIMISIIVFNIINYSSTFSAPPPPRLGYGHAGGGGSATAGSAGGGSGAAGRSCNNLLS